MRDVGETGSDGDIMVMEEETTRWVDAERRSRLGLERRLMRRRWQRRGDEDWADRKVRPGQIGEELGTGNERRRL